MQFKPDYTPKQMFEMGIFAGMYFRPINSTVTNKTYKNAHKEFGFLNNVGISKLNNGTWDASINKYKIRAGLPLKYWEEHGWIKPQDPYGQVQWYCRYHSGRRTPDDNRQIKRALNFLVRFGQRKNPSDKVKQALLQWGWNWEKKRDFNKIKELVRKII